MQAISEFLGSDHHACDDVFALAEEAVADDDWSRARELFGHFDAALARHLAMEEDVLFPAFEARTGMSGGPTAVMRMEHAQMRDLVHAMADAVAANDRNTYLGHAETLNMLMQQHNLKEENMLYPMTDRVLGADSGGVIREMQAVAQ